MAPNTEDGRRKLLAVVFLTLIVSVYIFKTILTFGLQSQSFNNPSAGQHIICYYTIPKVNSTKNLLPEDIDPFICTHIIIGFAAIVNNTVAPIYESDIEIYQGILGLKKQNPSLRVLVSVGEIVSSGVESQFRRVVSSQESRSRFVKESMKYVTRHSFDGLDLDWEFPSWPRKDEGEKRNFSLLLKELRQAAESEEVLLTAAVAAPRTIILQSYEIDRIAHYVDFINLMSYDFFQYTPVLPLTGPNSPLFPRPQDSGFKSTLNINWTAHYWLNGGMPREKIIIGIPTYGHSFKLLNLDNSGWFAPASGFGRLGQDGFTKSSEVCQFLNENGTKQVYDDHYLVPYAVNGFEWVSYDNEKSVRTKANYIKGLQFGGAMIFSLNTDDYSGECGDVKFPLTKQVNKVLSAPDERVVLA